MSKTINKILDMYSEYCKLMKFEKLPIITFTRQELKTAIIDTDRYYDVLDTLNKKKALGICSTRKDKSTVIMIDVFHKQFKKLNGLHEIIPLRTYTKVTKKHRYRVTERDVKASIEHTLIHELVHAKHQNMPHGKRFEAMVEYYYETLNKPISE